MKMGKAKIAITIDEKIVGRIDRLVKQKTFTNRSQAIEQAMHDKLARLDKSRLARESAKLEPKLEQAMAEEGIQEDQQLWPQF
jgi:metal-responsive CopG/Arc/MetJ family transcriptional regulator